MKFKLFVAWYDFYFGFFFDRNKKILYIGFPPTIMWSFSFGQNWWNGQKWVAIKCSGCGSTENELNQDYGSGWGLCIDCYDKVKVITDEYERQYQIVAATQHTERRGR